MREEGIFNMRWEILCKELKTTKRYSGRKLKVTWENYELFHQTCGSGGNKLFILQCIREYKMPPTQNFRNISAITTSNFFGNLHTQFRNILACLASSRAFRTACIFFRVKCGWVGKEEEDREWVRKTSNAREKLSALSLASKNPQTWCCFCQAKKKAQGSSKETKEGAKWRKYLCKML